MVTCSSCSHYLPHPQYKYIGYCSALGSIVLGGNPPCESFSPLTRDALAELLELRGWVYCVDCRHPIFDLDEALEHAARGDKLSISFMFDEVAREEASPAD